MKLKSVFISLCFILVMSVASGCGILLAPKPSETPVSKNTDSSSFLWGKRDESESQSPEPATDTPEDTSTDEPTVSDEPSEAFEKPSEPTAQHAGVDIWTKMSREEKYALNKRLSYVMMREIDIENYDKDYLFSIGFWTIFNHTDHYSLNQLDDYEIELIINEDEINNFLKDMYNITLGVMDVPEYEYRDGSYVAIVPPTGFYGTSVSRISSFVGNPDGTYTLEIMNYDVEFAEDPDSLFYPDLDLKTLDNTMMEAYYWGKSRAVVAPFNESGYTVYKILRYENLEVVDPVIINY